ncbi:MAG: PAS domain S-box protein [Bdellovibrionales bacterium]|nr:PAS domain S-box protein [Bdellovibrionales bacterium]
MDNISPVYSKFAIRTILVVLFAVVLSIGLTYFALGRDAAIVNAAIMLICATLVSLGAWYYVTQPLSDMFTRAHADSMNDFFQRFRAILDSMEDGLVVQDSDGKIIDFNESAMRILGLTDEEMLGRDSMDSRWRSIDEDGNDLPGEKHPAMIALRTDRPARGIMGVSQPSGNISWLSVAASPMVRLESLNDGGAKSETDRQVITIFRDITADRTMRERLEIGVRAVKFGIWDWNIAENRLYWDPSMYQVYGVDPKSAESPQAIFERAVHPEDHRKIADHLKRTIERQAGYSDEFRIRHTDGSVRTLRAESKGFYDKEGKPIRHIGVNWDITEQRAQELRILQSSRMASLGEMASAIAHEINNPLAIISGQIDLLRSYVAKGAVPNEKLMTAMERIDKMALRVAVIIRGLRTFSRDGSEDPIETVSLGALIDDTVALCQARFLNHRVNLVVNIDKDSRATDFECRPTQISQVLVNLLNNAFDAAKDRPERWVKLDAETFGDFVQICVTDSGAGIPPEIQDKVMQPFFTTKSIGEGTGLGLSISLGIVSSHDGKLSIDKTCPNTRFVILLPRRQMKGLDGLR